MPRSSPDPMRDAAPMLTSAHLTRARNVGGTATAEDALQQIDSLVGWVGRRDLATHLPLRRAQLFGDSRDE